MLDEGESGAWCCWALQRTSCTRAGPQHRIEPGNGRPVSGKDGLAMTEMPASLFSSEARLRLNRSSSDDRGLSDCGQVGRRALSTVLQQFGAVI